MKLPLYYQLYCKLRTQIDTGMYLPGDMLPTEQELIETFSTSRSPVRQALSLLENEGLIKRFPGKGTFVSAPPKELLMWFNFSPFRKHFKKDWDKIHCETLLAEMRQPPEEIRSFFFLDKKEKTVYLERIRFLDSQPVIYSQHYFQTSLSLQKIVEAGDFFSVRAMLMEYFSIEITRIDEILRAVPAPCDVAKHLNINNSYPLMLTERRSFSNDSPVQFDFFYTITDIWDYHVVFEKGTDGRIIAAASN